MREAALSSGITNGVNITGVLTALDEVVIKSYESDSEDEEPPELDEADLLDDEDEEDEEDKGGMTVTV